jgi:hypothetical protein
MADYQLYIPIKARMARMLSECLTRTPEHNRQILNNTMHIIEAICRRTENFIFTQGITNTT